MTPHISVTLMTHLPCFLSARVEVKAPWSDSMKSRTAVRGRITVGSASTHPWRSFHYSSRLRTQQNKATTKNGKGKRKWARKGCSRISRKADRLTPLHASARADFSFEYAPGASRLRNRWPEFKPGRLCDPAYIGATTATE